MIDVHTLYLVGLISQATFALTLMLLAWSDRRTRGTPWLAGACALQFAWTASRAANNGRVSRLSEALSACLLVLLLCFVYVGFRWFVKQRGIESNKEPLAAAGAILLVLAASAANMGLGVLLGRCISLGIGIKAASMLWRCRIKGLRATARACSLVVALAMGIIVVNLLGRVPMEAWLTGFREPVSVVVMRSVTITLVTLLSFSFVALFVGETNRRLQEDTRTDSLTRLRNRRAMEEVAIREVWQAVRKQVPLALLMLDLDHFKNLNDTWGHALGDRALKVVGSVLQREMGPRELTARMGGEEFAILLPGCSLEDAGAVAERLRISIAALRLHETENSASMTVSIGVSVLRDGEQSWTEMLCRADDALYRAKRAGRNQVTLCAIGANPMSAEPPPEKSTWRSRYSVPRQML
jgi:diguanylate cyclase (GGDEF)-like protein